MVRGVSVLVSTLGVVLAAGVAPAAASSGLAPIAPLGATSGDNFPGSLALHQQALRDRALDELPSGDAIRRGSVVKLGNQFVQLKRTGTDQALVVLAEFSDEGPLHNQIAKPDRKAGDNGTNWRKNFNRDYFKKLAFGREPHDESMHNYYIQQSSNR